MGFVEMDGLRAYQFELFDSPGILHGVFTRRGGVSPAPWASLNHGGTVGDERTHVIENRRRVFSATGRAVESIFDVWQVHGTEVRCANAPRPLDQMHEQADAIVTDRPEITLFMRFADCVPILFFDPIRRVVAIAHAGWKGTLDRIGAVTVQRMHEQYGCRLEDVLVGIGPSICAAHYQVGDEVVQKTRNTFGDRASEALIQKDDRFHLDLWEANRMVLRQAGVLNQHIQVAGLCTLESPQDWYSHRGEHGKTGRFGAIVALTG